MADQAIRERLSIYRAELEEELTAILDFWMDRMPDDVYGGFTGRIDEEGRTDVTAPKGSVLNARILWSFSAAYDYRSEPRYLEMAGRAYQYIINHFIDKEEGGVYWSVDYEGRPLETKKQVYAIAFTIYAFSEYYRASGFEEAKEQAVALFRLLAEKAYDTEKTGYFEAFTRGWQPIADLRLSAKDENEKKTMNTHLHVLEAYAALYRIWPDDALREQLNTLLDNFWDHFINRNTGHLSLFFDEDWNGKSGLVSYGHDIEATWLLLEAAEVVSNTQMIERISMVTQPIADAVIEGIDGDGGLWYEYEPNGKGLIKEKHWWVQAEAMAGYFNAWQLSGDEKYLERSLQNWDFVKKKILDKQHGEWLWGITATGERMPGQDKAGIWKCPYHNSRACIEIIKRIDLTLKKNRSEKNSPIRSTHFNHGGADAVV